MAKGLKSCIFLNSDRLYNEIIIDIMCGNHVTWCIHVPDTFCSGTLLGGTVCPEHALFG